MLQSLHSEPHGDLLAESRVHDSLPKISFAPTGVPEPEELSVRFGSEVFLVRPLNAGDMRALQEFFYSHNEETIRLRYGYPRKWMTDESAYKLAAVDQRRDPALGIFTEENGRQAFRAIGRYYLDDDGKKAEIAFVVHESTRNMGMAGYLISKMAEIAKKRGIAEFWANVLPDNRTMAGMFVAVGGKESKSLMDDDRTFTIGVEGILSLQKKFLKEKRIETIES